MSRLVLTQITIKKERSISSTTWYYLLQPSNASAPDPTNYGNPPPTYTDTGYSGWSTTEPTYTVGDDRVLYIMVQTLYSDNTFSYATPTISSSYEAAKVAYNEALQAEADIEDLQELGLHHGYIWYNSTARSASGGIPVYPVGSYIASGINNTINQTNSNTYGLNTWISTGGINLRYNAINLAKLTTSTLEFYYPSTSSQGTAAISLGTHDGINSLIFYGFGSINKQMELTATALNFYGSSQSTADATLDSNGLKLVKGGIKAGIDGQDGFVYLSSEDYPLRDFIKTEDIVIDDNKVYYIIDNYKYIPVTEPVLEDIENYYEVKSTAPGIDINGHVPSKGITPSQENILLHSNLTNDNSADGKVNYDDPAWREVIGTKFGVDSEGNLYASNVDINGQITAISGAIGGWQIGTDTNKSLYYEYNIPGASETNLVLSPESAENVISIGGSETNLTWFISVGNIFGVTTKGKLYSTSGRIGGWAIDANSLQSVSGSVGLRSADTDIVFWAGASSSSADAPFRITKDGALYANNINFQSGGETIVSLLNRELRISSANIVNNLTLGQFKWIVDNNRLTLMRI